MCRPSGISDRFRLLVERKARWQHAAPQGTDALIWAASAGRVPCVAFLLGLGCDINRKAAADYTALHYAAAGGQLECVRLLLEMGIDRTVKATRTKAFFKAIEGV